MIVSIFSLILLTLLVAAAMLLLATRGGRRVAAVVMGAVVAIIFVLVAMRAGTRANTLVRMGSPVSTSTDCPAMEVYDDNAHLRMSPGTMELRDDDTVARLRPGRVEIRNGDTLMQLGPGGISVDDGESAVKVAPGSVAVESKSSSGGAMTGTTSHEPWKSAADLGFDADVYPSMAAAAEVLAAQLMSSPDASIERVELWARNPRNGATQQLVTAEVVSAVAARLQRMQPEWRISTHEAEPSASAPAEDAETVRIHLSVASSEEHRPAAWDKSAVQYSGMLRMTLASAHRGSERVARFIDKPWVENCSAFLSSQQGRFVVGWSSPTATDRMQSRGQAIRDAAAQLAQQVRTELAKRPGLSWDERWVEGHIQPIAQSFVKDQFAQTFVRPYGGQVCREAVLIDAKPAIEAAVGKCLAAGRVQTETRWAGLGSAAALIAVVCVLGMFVNVVTKGYYRGRLVAVGGLLVVIGVIVILKLMAYRMAWVV